MRFTSRSLGNMAVFRLVLIPLIIGGAAAQVQIEPQNLAVLLGSQALFNCSTTLAQPTMAWSLNGIFVVSIQNGIIVTFDTRFSSKIYNTPGIFKTELIISKVMRNDTGEVLCQCLGGQAGMSRLSVQERGKVVIAGGNRTVIQGSQTEFQCQALGWSPEPDMSWSVNGVVVKNCTNSSVAQGNAFNTICTLPVTATINSSVQCLVKVSSMSSPDISTVFLSVGPNYTILIAVTVAFSAAALLFLLIFGIFFFCRRRKKEKSGYEEEVRRARLQSQHMATITSDARGRDDRGYVTDGRYGENHNGAVWNKDYSPKPQRSYPKDDFFDNGYKNHRHMTMV